MGVDAPIILRCISLMNKIIHPSPYNIKEREIFLKLNYLIKSYFCGLMEIVYLYQDKNSIFSAKIFR